MNSKTRNLLVGAVVLLAAGGTGAALWATKSAHDRYVKETLALLPEAEGAYARSSIGLAEKAAADAVARESAHPTWFAPEDKPRILALRDFLAGQRELWDRGDRLNSDVDRDPAAARAGLEELLAKAKALAPRSEPILARFGPSLARALAKERELAEAAARKVLPDAAKAYEEGKWEALDAALAASKAAIDALPPASREAAAKALEADLKPATELAALVAGVRGIKDLKEDGPAKADLLRGKLAALAFPKARDAALRREILKLVAEVEPETRPAPDSMPLTSGIRQALVSAWTRGGGWEIVDAKDESAVVLQGPVHRVVLRLGASQRLLVEVDRVRLAFSVDHVRGQETAGLELAVEAAAGIRASKHAFRFAAEPWEVKTDAPGRYAAIEQGTKIAAWFEGRIFEGDKPADLDLSKELEAFLASARALEQVVLSNAGLPEEYRGPLAAMIRGAHSRAPPQDHLDGPFCRYALATGYIESQAPKVDEALAAALKSYRDAYAEFARPRIRLELKAADGSTLAGRTNLEREAHYRVRDAAAKRTIFSIPPRDHMGSRLAVVSVYEGLHDEIPGGAEPVEVRMRSGVAGELSRWTAAGGKLEFDAERWTAAMNRDVRWPEHFGNPAWQVPPHALKVDGRGQAREMLLPGGSLKAEAFDAIAAGPERVAAQDRWVKRCGEVLESPGELHLLYRYFVQYVLDSPVTTANGLIGSSRFTGDVHQRAYQTLDRRQAGRYLTDCDDLAELYWTILRSQGRPAFVLGVPGHATCGLAEKDGEGWTFFCVDTGPPRLVKAPELDAAVERLLKSYDDDGSMSFDPRQMQFLFRFAGEPTRSPYWLDSRVLRDPPYADLMIQVQEYWHFGFYALGIETMKKLLENDKAPANCTEIAGLYERVGMHAEALKWADEGLKGLDPKDDVSRLDESQRRVQALRGMKKDAEALEVQRAAARELVELVAANPREGGRLRPLRFRLAGGLAGLDQPWEGWALIREDVTRIVGRGMAPESLMGMVTGIYAAMAKVKRGGRELSEDEAKQFEELEALLARYQATGLFKADDSGMELWRKYGQLYSFLSAKLGPEAAAAELLKPEFPKEPRQHQQRKGATPEQDWAWIRLSPLAWADAIGAALDKDSKTAGGPAVAVARAKAMEVALAETAKQGALGPLEFSVLGLRLMRALLDNDEKLLRAVFAEMKRQSWADLTESLARTLGATAERMKVEDFEKAFRIFAGHGVPRRHYYGVVYAAVGADAPKHALAASRICRELFPDDADMRREHALLEQISK